MRLIDADALMETLGITDMDCNKCAWCDMEWNNCKRGGAFEDACCAIENAPTVEERKTGKWIMNTDPYGFFDEIPVCSECGHTTKMRETYNFCPNCGARMEA